MKLYQAFDVDEETPVQYVGVYTTRWRPEWGQPTVMFHEVDDKTQALADAAPNLLRACKAAIAYLVQSDSFGSGDADWERTVRALKTVIANAENG